MILLLKTERRRQPGATHASQARGSLARGIDAARAVLMTVPSLHPLTERELDVLELLDARLSNQEIATCLVTSVPEVKRHAANAYRKLRLSNRSPTVREVLTPHELAVLRLLVDRLTVREMAHELDISPFTVKRHPISLCQKLDVQDRWQAAARARALGLLSVRSGGEKPLGTDRASAPVHLLRPRGGVGPTLVTNMPPRREASSPPGGASPAATVAPPVGIDRPTETMGSRGDIGTACTDTPVEVERLW
jgi:DNA-binding NarL/FixJ family response regulator